MNMPVHSINDPKHLHGMTEHELKAAICENLPSHLAARVLDIKRVQKLTSYHAKSGFYDRHVNTLVEAILHLSRERDGFLMDIRRLHTELERSRDTDR